MKEGEAHKAYLIVLFGLVVAIAQPGMGFFSFETAWRTLQGFEIMNMICKGQVQGVLKGDVRGQVTLVTTLFGIAA